MFTIKVKGNIISVQETDPITSGSVSVYKCQFIFDNSWDGFFRSAVFRCGSMVKTVPLDAEDMCDLPWELLEKKHIGLPVEVSVYGTKDETEILPTIWDKLGRVRSGSEPGEDVQRYSPSVYERIVSLIKAYSEKTKGDKGDKGDPGEGDMTATVYDLDGAVASEGGISSYVGGQIGTHNSDTAAHADIRAELATKTNPNLLHNWYFANPVDQRGGWVVPPGVTYYTFTWEEIGTTDKYYPVLRRRDAVDNYDCEFEVDGVRYVTGGNNAVRGYVGAGYTIDRWIAPDGTLTLRDGAIFLSGGNFTTCVENGSDLFGKTLTFSVLTKDGLVSGTAKLNDSYDTWGVTYFVDSVAFQYRANNVFALLIAKETFLSGAIAVKLELGSVQTLAHQDADGNWVLNEIPDYGEELRKCQRYYYQTWTDTPTILNGPTITGFPLWESRMPTVRFPVEMASTPNVKILGAMTGTEGCISDWVSDEDLVTDASAVYVTPKGFIPASQTGGLELNRSYHFHYSASADL